MNEGLTLRMNQCTVKRVGRKRTDLVHLPLDPVIVVGPWVAAAGAAVAGGRALVRSLVH